MDKEVTIELTDNIERIMCQNLDEKMEEYTVTLKSCEDCRYYDKPYIRGGNLHCCSYDYENNRTTQTSRDVQDLYDNCPINHEVEVRKIYLKKYGIIHTKPSRSRYSRRGSIAIVDFSGTVFEWDGNNPDVYDEPVVIFYYNNQEEADKMMEVALDYYNRFNLDAEYVPKHCYG